MVAKTFFSFFKYMQILSESMKTLVLYRITVALHASKQRKTFCFRNAIDHFTRPDSAPLRPYKRNEANKRIFKFNPCFTTSVINMINLRI